MFEYKITLKQGTLNKNGWSIYYSYLSKIYIINVL